MMHQCTLNTVPPCPCNPSYRKKTFKCTRTVSIPQPVVRYHSHCIPRDVCSPPSHMCYAVYRCSCPPIPSVTIHSCGVMPSTCTPMINRPCHQSPCCRNTPVQPKPIDPSSYRVTVRRISPFHITPTVRNNISDPMYFQPFNQIVANDDQSHRIAPTMGTSDRNDLYSANQNTPSVPSKKLVPKNGGTHLSSTSFITTSDDQQNSVSDGGLDKNSERLTSNTQPYQQWILSKAVAEASLDSARSFAQLQPTLSNKDVLKNEVVERHSGTSGQPTVQSSNDSDKTNEHQRYSSEQKLSPLQTLSDSILNKPFNDNDESIAKTSPFNISLSLTPVVPKPPNIDQIKSKEMLLHSSLSNQSLTLLNHGKQKSAANVSKTSLGLRNARSILDLGSLFEDNTT